MQFELPLAHLNPVSEDIVDIHDFAGQFADITQTVLIGSTVSLHFIGFGNNAVELRDDGIYKRHLCPAFYVAMPIFPDMLLVQKYDFLKFLSVI